jgi:cytochrome c peroxidase
MPKRALVSRLLLLAGAAFMAGSKCNDESVFSFFSDTEWAQIQTLTNLPAAPADTTNAFANDSQAALLGKKYFFDKRFSGPLTHAANDGVSPEANGAVGETAKVSCARCHNPATGFSDQRTVPDNTSLGAGFTGRNAPTLYNVEQNTWYFWDGRKDSLWSQALGPTESAVEHNGNRVQFAMVIRDLYVDGSVNPGAVDPDHDDVFGTFSPLLYELDDPMSALATALGGPVFPTPPAAPDFAGQGRPGDGPAAGAFAAYDDMPQAYKDAVDLVFSHFGKAIHAYERLIVSTNSDFDKFVAGVPSGFSLAAQRGLKLFLGKGKCVMCHSGPNFTDNLFHNIGVQQTGTQVPLTDEGRFNGVPQVNADPFNGVGAFSDDTAAGALKLPALQNVFQHGQFKTPTLRSIGETGPYMHTGHIKSLDAVMLFYNRGGDTVGFLGTSELGGVSLLMTPGELSDLVAFMRSLEGEDLPAAVTDPPILP